MRPEAERFRRLAPGRSRAPPPARAAGGALMGVLRRAKREVYRVYSEEEFLSPIHALTDWSVSPAERASRQRWLRRLAGMAAVTGAAGTVVGALALASVGSRSDALRITASATPRPAAVQPASAPRHPQGRRRPLAGHSGRRHPVDALRAPSVGGKRSIGRRPWISALSRRSGLTGRIDTTARPVANDSAEDTAEPARRSEFGFER
jgi:hypothetical protein